MSSESLLSLDKIKVSTYLLSLYMYKNKSRYLKIYIFIIKMQSRKLRLKSKTLKMLGFSKYYYNKQKEGYN